MAQAENENLLRGINFAVLVAEGFETVSLLEAQHALEQAGAILQFISPQRGEVHGIASDGSEKALDVHLPLDEADPQAYAGVMVTGGKQHIETLRGLETARQFLQSMAHEGKPIAVLGEAIALLADAGVVSGHAVAASPDIKEAIDRAGGRWTNQPVVCDGFLISGRSAAELTEFIHATLSVMERHVRETVRGTGDEQTSLGPSS